MNIKFENLEKIDLLLEKIEFLTNSFKGEKRWLNITETAHYLGYSKEYIHKLKDSSFILNKHYFKRNGKLLFDKYELDNWVQGSTQINIDPKELANEILKDIL